MPAHFNAGSLAAIAAGHSWAGSFPMFRCAAPRRAQRKPGACLLGIEERRGLVVRGRMIV